MKFIPMPELVSSPGGRLAYYAIEACVVMVIIVSALRLWSYPLEVPFNYRGDSMVILMYVKGLIQNGWTFVIPQLSAPYTMSAAAFPLATSVDWGLMKFISLFTSKVGLVLNSFWLLTLVFSAWSATFSMRLLGVGHWLSFAGGLLFAFIPFALIRNVVHLNLVYYSVPLLCLLAIYLAQGDDRSVANGATIRRAGYAGCLIQGFNYVYFSFFAVGLFAVAALIGYGKGKSAATVRVAALAVGIIVVSTLLNLTPSFVSWYQHGKPPEMDYKHPVEAEFYGAKIRKMVAPHPDNPLLGRWGRLDFNAQFPNENENVTARLGMYGSTGFLLLLAIALSLVRVDGNCLPAITTLAVFTLLVITVGGFGAVFNLLIVPDIRCYNRFSVFLSFFSIAGLSLWLKAKSIEIDQGWRKKTVIALLTSFILLSLYDQLLDSKGLLSLQQSDIAAAAGERGFVARLEKAYPYEANVFQLPVTGFPLMSIHERMESYDHLRPFIWSTHLHWSWPSFSQRHRAWQDRIAGLEGGPLVKALVLSGFDLVWLDRFAYKDDGRALEHELITAGAQEVLVGESERYAVFALHEVKKKLSNELGPLEFSRQAAALLNRVSLSWEKGFYSKETRADGVEFFWSRQKSRLMIRNHFGNYPIKVKLSFDIQTQGSGIVQISSSQGVRAVAVGNQPTPVTVDVAIPQGSTEKIEFSAALPQVTAPGDPREMFFAVINPKVEESPVVQ